MPRSLVTGSCGLVGSAACRRLLGKGWEVVGIDNDLRGWFFGEAASTKSVAEEFLLKHPAHYHHYNFDIRCLDQGSFRHLLHDMPMDLCIHAAAQPSHDWAATNIGHDFHINAVATMNLLCSWHKCCPKSPFIHISTNKVYGDRPNNIYLLEQETRFEVSKYPSIEASFWNGISEMFGVDHCTHSFFGVSKLAADMLAQEFGRNFGLPVMVLRPGCITGANHKATEQHGFLAYLMKCVATGTPYTVFGYNGKQLRDNLHADDLVDAIMLMAANPRPGEVYNVGGGRGNECSVIEAIECCQKWTGKNANISFVEQPRKGDHMWYISNCQKLKNDYGWEPKRNLSSIMEELWEVYKCQQQ
jgi:CDP-paratose 2-epimerase